MKKQYTLKRRNGFLFTIFNIILIQKHPVTAAAMKPSTPIPTIPAENSPGLSFTISSTNAPITAGIDSKNE